jgi:thiamine kinase-like enzyme
MAELDSTVGRLAPLLGAFDGELVPLDGGITNRNYRARFGGRDYVVRLPSPDTAVLSIDRAAERLANECAAKLGLAPAVVAALDDPPVSVTRFVEGAAMVASGLQEPDALVAVAVALRRVHGSGAVLPHAFSAFRLVEDYAGVVRARGGSLPGGYDEALDCARRVELSLRHPEHGPVPCHNDLLPANFIRDGDRIWIVDWEYAGMGDRWFDLGNFAVNNELDTEAEALLIEAYFDEPPLPRRCATLALMRFMSDFREAMWGVVQSAVSDLDFDFDGYAGKHFARLHATAADPRFDGWLDVARA